MNSGKDFETLVEAIYKKLDKTSVITKNDKVFGHDSSQYREIDISIKSKIGIHPILIVVQARDYNKPVDINVIGEFLAVIGDVKANKGILISAKGFTKGAINLAKTKGIEILTAHDTKNPKWELKLDIPVILTTFIGDFYLDFIFKANDDYTEKVTKSNRKIQMPTNFQFQFTRDKGQSIIVPIDDYKKLFLENKLIPDGTEHIINYSDSDLELIVEKGLYVPATELNIKYSLTKKTYYKLFELTEFQGLINIITSEINPANFRLVSNEFTIENYQLQDIKQFSFENWTLLEDSNELLHPFKINLYHFPKLRQNVPTKVISV